MVASLSELKTEGKLKIYRNRFVIQTAWVVLSGEVSGVAITVNKTTNPIDRMPITATRTTKSIKKVTENHLGQQQKKPLLLEFCGK